MPSLYNDGKMDNFLFCNYNFYLSTPNMWNWSCLSISHTMLKQANSLQLFLFCGVNNCSCSRRSLRWYASRRMLIPHFHQHCFHFWHCLKILKVDPSSSSKKDTKVLRMTRHSLYTSPLCGGMKVRVLLCWGSSKNNLLVRLCPLESDIY